MAGKKRLQCSAPKELESTISVSFLSPKSWKAEISVYFLIPKSWKAKISVYFRFQRLGKQKSLSLFCLQRLGGQKKEKDGSYELVSALHFFVKQPLAVSLPYLIRQSFSAMLIETKDYRAAPDTDRKPDTTAKKDLPYKRQVTIEGFV